MIDMQNKLFDNFDAIIITSPTNRFYFSQIKTSFGVLLLLKDKKYYFTDFRYAIETKNNSEGIEIIITNPTDLYSDVKKILSDNLVKTVGYEETDLTVSKFNAIKKELSEFKLKSVGEEIDELRIIKSDAEINKIKKAQRITEQALEKALQTIKLGVTERELSAEITYQLLLSGADGNAFDNIVAFGENSAECHHTVSDRKLEKGDIVLIDIGAKYQNYCSDMTRTFCYGEPPKKLIELYDLVKSAQVYVLKHIKAGMTGSELDTLAREFFKANGYEQEFGHSLGHGVGIKIHEKPNLSRTYSQPLPENAVVTVEPGLYIENFGGVRIEDMVVIKKDGIENLTNYPKTLII